MDMKKDLYNTNQANTLRLRTPIRLNIHCRGEPEAINIYHKRYFSAIENPLIEVVVPVLNEERILKANIETLYHFLRTQPGLIFRITIADNGSTDKTQAIANDLANSHAAIRVVRLDKKGRGRALKQVWMESEEEILSYMDIDLSTSEHKLDILTKKTKENTENNLDERMKMDEVSKKNKKETRAGTIAGIAAGGVTIAALCFFIGTQVAGNNSARSGMGGPGGMSGQMGNPPGINGQSGNSQNRPGGQGGASGQGKTNNSPQDSLNKQGGNQQDKSSRSVSGEQNNNFQNFFDDKSGSDEPNERGGSDQDELDGQPRTNRQGKNEETNRT
jgi:gtrA family protein